MNIKDIWPLHKSPAVSLLIVVNLISLYGIFFWNWDLFIILLLFWLENVVIGIINAIKLIIIRPDKIEFWIMKVFLLPFFCIHYGAFTAGHGFFILAFFGEQTALMEKFDEGFSVFISEFYILLQEYSLVWVLSAIIVSHVFSFVWNYIGRDEWRSTDPQKQMMKPYLRVAVLHVLVILSGFLVAALSAPTFLLVLIVLLKIVLDVILHLRSHTDKPHKWLKV